RPSAVVMSAATVLTFTLVFERISSAVSASTSALRPLIVTSTPASASAIAHPLPRPLLAAQTRAFFPDISYVILIAFSISGTQKPGSSAREETRQHPCRPADCQTSITRRYAPGRVVRHRQFSRSSGSDTPDRHHRTEACRSAHQT